MLCILTNICFAKSKALRVGVVTAAPFATQSSRGEFHGFVISLWQYAAVNAGSYKLINAGGNAADAITALQEGKYDALIGPLSVNSERIAKVHFSRPFFINRLGLITLGQKLGLWGIIGRIVWHVFSIAIFIYIVLVLLFALIFCLLERAKKAEFYSDKSLLKAYGYSVWETLIMFLCIEAHNEPCSVLTRFFTVIWVFLSLIFSAGIIASLTSSLTISLSTLKLGVNVTPESVYDHNVAVTKGGYSEFVTKRLGARVVEVKTMEQAINLLEQGKVMAVVGNYLQIEYYLDKHPDTKVVNTKLVLGVNEMAFAFPKSSTQLAQTINQGLTRLQDDNFAYGICAKYLTVQESEHCVI